MVDNKGQKQTSLIWVRKNRNSENKTNLVEGMLNPYKHGVLQNKFSLFEVHVCIYTCNSPIAEEAHNVKHLKTRAIIYMVIESQIVFVDFFPSHMYSYF